MNYINLTPHAINVVDDAGLPLLTVEPSGTLARVSTHIEVVGHLGEERIPVTTSIFGEVEGLPEPAEDNGTVYIVSALVAQRVKRPDVYVPSESVRDEKGRIVGCRSLGLIL